MVQCDENEATQALRAKAAAAAASVAYVEQLYSDFTTHPDRVDAGWRGLFSAAEQSLPPQDFSVRTSDKVTQNQEDRGAGIYRLIEVYRHYGHLEAHFNPIKASAPEPHAGLDHKNLGFSDADLSRHFSTMGLLPSAKAPLRDIIDTLRRIYCSSIGFEYMGLQRPDMERWLQEQLEPGILDDKLGIEKKRSIFQHLNKSELFEVFLHTKYPGQKRFSLEGAETLIPIMAALIEEGAELGLEAFVVGMAHRGRLNVLSNILNKSYEDIFSEFEDTYRPETFFEGSGDVKYHKGFRAEITTVQGKRVSVELPANPSHLEAINTVVEGIVRAKEVKVGDDIEMQRVLPILIHGDAAVAGQGIVYETLQLHGLPGYGVGGTVHVIINNQIGFTTLPKDGRSTRYCTDIARSFSAPVFHVNAEDPEGCVYATHLALALRQRFHCDVFIELNGWRKYGHNEGDEPAFTQPKEYEIIRSKSHSIRELYRESLVHQGVMERHMVQEEEESFKAGLQEALSQNQSEKEEKLSSASLSPARAQENSEELFRPLKTGVSAETLRQLAESFCTVPKGFNAHSKLKRLLKSRLAVFEAQAKQSVVDWGMAEHLAFASLLNEGIHVRLSGQDSRRGTFSHRHAMWIDQKNAKKYFPLSHLSDKQGRFDVFNSPLSEYGVLGFEFGYSLEFPEALVLWEAQFGDFCNGAQIVIDQFISTSEQKWGKTLPLVMLLPHGFEGQGPEHSSARMERFLQLAGDNNMFVVNPTTPAQLFHLLRSQVLRSAKKPLIIFTPKGLLRHPLCVSSIQELESGEFQCIIDDHVPVEKVRRLAFCSGRIYYDLIKERKEREDDSLAIIRLEQLYPLDTEGIRKILRKYDSCQAYYWVQEEPQNMGAWGFIRPQKHKLLPSGSVLRYVGRARSASPAAGSFHRHKREYAQMITELFEPIEGHAPLKKDKIVKASRG